MVESPPPARPRAGRWRFGQGAEHIDGTRVVWIEFRSDGSAHIYLYDLVTQTERRLMRNTASRIPRGIAISGNRIVRTRRAEWEFRHLPLRSGHQHRAPDYIRHE